MTTPSPSGQKNPGWLRVLLGISYSVPQEVRQTRMRRIRIAFLAVISLSFLFTMYKLVYDGPRIGGINNVNLFFLLNLNILILLVMAALVARNLVKLYLERKDRPRGTGFKTRLILAFLGLTLIPSVLLFVVASGLITNSISNWSNITVERSLRDAMDIAQTQYGRYSHTAANSATASARAVKDRGLLLPAQRRELDAFIKNHAESSGASSAAYGEGLTLVAEYPKTGGRPRPPGNVNAAFRQTLERGETVSEMVRSEGGGAWFWALAPVTGPGGELAGAVFAATPADPWLLDKIAAIRRTTDEYRQLQLLKLPITSTYEITLAVVTLAVIFGAIWFGIHLAREITVPIQQLVDATQKVAEGDLSVRVEEKSKDEIGFLVSSFNRMTEDLASSRTRLEASHRELVATNQELDRRRVYIETIVSNIAAGVIAIDGRGHLSACNPSAVNILHIKEKEPFGKYYEEVFNPEQLDTIRGMMREMGRSERESIKKEIRIAVDGAQRALLVHLSELKDARGAFMGIVVVFEDISAIINAEKTAAWREIAQHMAHEIKNPLTPIRLNTERLRRNFEQDREAFDRNFDKATGIIIQEVDVLRGLVDEFSRFGQLPVAKPEPSSLYEIIEGVADLFRGAKQGLEIRTEHGPGIGPVRLDREQTHRAFRNLVENAVHAMEEKGTIEIRTRLDEAGKNAVVEITDNGPGIDPAIMDKIFLPYFSTKKKGGGLGLAIVNRIVADHEGHITARNISPHGLCMTVTLPLA